MVSDTPVLTCANHPGVETGVSCGKCGKPLCPKCMIFTPVGVRCKQCAQLRPPPQYDLSGAVRARVLAAAMAIVVAGGGLLGWLHLVSFGIFASMAIGFGAGEVLSRVSARKRGRLMDVIAGATVVLTLVVADSVMLLLRHASPGAALLGALALLSTIYGVLGLILGVVVAVGRVGGAR
ncbi:MAG: hypothetical protein NVSMB65_06950 [Chloroflexota bacterium]